MALSGSLPQINLGIQGETQGGDSTVAPKEYIPSLENRQENWRETRGNNRYADNSRPRREFNRFESQGVADNRRFDGRRRGGQSDHRFHNQGGRQGGSSNSAFRGIDFMKESKLTLDFDQKSLIIPDDQIKQLPKVEKPVEIDLSDTKLGEGKSKN
ncbi:uncharacterized protein TNCV_4771751 [Trichonephila clavipes]|nr:uncharacterized protein TNCV_4771751 [Trichonephila clavipes]